MKNYLALDIGGTALKYGIVDENGNVVESYETSVCFDNYETPILETIIKVLDTYLLKHPTLAGIAVSATGQINVHQGKVIGVGGNIKNYLNTEIKQTLEKKYHLPTTVVNDANAVALAEKWVGAGKTYQNIVVITIGTGVGGGVIVNGKLLEGAVGIAGEIGHFSIQQDGKQCTCGMPGCFETYASMRALVQEVNQALNVNWNGKLIFEHIHDSKVKQFVEDWIKKIAVGSASLIHIFNPDLVIFGGGVSKQTQLFLKPLQETINQLIMPRFKESVEIVAAQLGNEAGMVGALYYHLQNQNNL